MSTTPFDLAIAAAFAVRRLGLRRALWGAILTTPLWLYSLPPVSCGCFGPTFRRCVPRTAAYRIAMKSDLKNLASQQEIYFSDNGSFSYDPEALGFVQSYGVEVTIMASPNGWAARTTHEAIPGQGCAIFVGDAADFLPDLEREAVPGEISCSE